ncbi:APC family permease [Yinghuangia seranimata]|uniref:APC family permease n=1 Tax=Yinghuangia seranimata TaxID=408067 RepID=UPI00248C94ED|nr:APC family permease [Yinghuangia seranimata]MDI2128795.1 APC family permease [Yinghuangia seranimata]
MSVDTPTRTAAAPAAAAAATAPGLKKTLGVRQGVVMALANMSPTVSIGLGLGLIGMEVGTSLPAAFLIACLPILGIAVGYARLSERDPNAGTTYIWVRRALGPWLGFMVGWIGVACSILFLAYGTQLAGQFTLGVVHELGGSVDPGNMKYATVIGILWAVGITWTAVRGVDVAARVQGILFGFAALVVVIVCVFAFAGWGDGGATNDFSAHWFNPFGFDNTTVLATGVLLCAYNFWGWETAFSVSEENVDKKVAGKAGLISIAIAVALFVFAAAAFERALSADEFAEYGANALPYLSDKIFGGPGALIAYLAMLLSTIACLQSSVIGGARLTMAMGRNGVLGKSWARLHPKHRTPAISTYRTVAISLVIAAAGTALGKLTDVIMATVTAVGILVSFGYGVTGVACVMIFRRELRRSVRNFLTLGLLPGLAGVALLLLGGYMVYSQWTSVDTIAFDAENGRFLTVVPLSIIAVGIPIAAWNRFVRKPDYFTLPRSVDPDSPAEIG